MLWTCYFCDVEDAPEKAKLYTQEALDVHIPASHTYLGVCPCCKQITEKDELNQGDGYCWDCVVLDHIDMDGKPFKDKIILSNIPVHDVWLKPTLYKGDTQEPSLIKKIVSGFKRLFR
jgi:hypothetical protein